MNVSFRRLLPAAIVLLAILLVLLSMAGFARHLAWHKGAQVQRSSPAVAGGAASPAQNWGDRFGDGTP
ncbi:MAG: hypothetical protein ABSG60_13290, partial [Terracidiphilus sp.]